MLISSFLIYAVEGRLLVTVRERTLLYPLLDCIETGGPEGADDSRTIGVVLFASDSNSKPGMGRPLEKPLLWLVVIRSTSFDAAADSSSSTCLGLC